MSSVFAMQILDTTIYVPASRSGHIYSAFSSSEIEKVSLPEGQLFAIELFYTSYKLSSDFKQSPLNKKRWDRLYEMYPQFQDSEIHRVETRQTQPVKIEEARMAFHGFKLHYVVADDPSGVENDLKYLGDLVEEKRFPNHIITEDGSSYRKYDPEIDKLRLQPKMYFPDTAVLHILKRNASRWKEILMVADMTGSMRYHTGQVLMWMNKWYRTKQLLAFTFFNDGDGKLTEEKRIGQTGGLYEGLALSYEWIAKQAKACISNRGANDVLENDLEAVLFGMEKFPQAEDVVLVVDNRSNFRDQSLVEKINRPLKIILCNTAYGINLNYLNLALSCRGSVHLKAGDIDMAHVKEGFQFIHNKQIYKIKNGVFVKANS